ncbi:MAG: LicD family protein, partial [Lachnospiraceae bacterium]|nr:LicD family protein [Lachnospiraceae bacterium]
DYYDEDFSFDNMRMIADEIRKRLKIILPMEEKLQYLDTVKKKNLLRTVEKSSHIYFGIDSTEIEHQYHRGRYIPVEVIFPLKKVAWEGEHFWVPNDAEEFLNYEFENIWEFPHDAGMPKHFGSLGIVEDIG